jgi:hypothetical protein
MPGVDWGSVEKYVDLADCYQHYLDPCYVAPKVRVWYLPWTWCYKPAARCAACSYPKTVVSPPLLSLSILVILHLFVHCKGQGQIIRVYK